jgi:hypothetical protein
MNASWPAATALAVWSIPSRTSLLVRGCCVIFGLLSVSGYANIQAPEPEKSLGTA